MLYNNDEFISLIKQRLSEKRFEHSMNVALSAVSLAKKYGANEEKAYTAGILHDIMKEESLDVQRKYIAQDGWNLTPLELSNKQVHHQMSGAAYCRIELGISDDEILNAIRYHTTGRRNMALLEKVIYTADFISAERCYPDVEVVREKAYESLESAMLYSLKYTITDLTGREVPIHTDTIECYNSIIEKFSEKE